MATRSRLSQETVQRCLWAIIQLAITYPWTTLVLALALVGASAWYAATHLEFQTSRNALVSAQARYIQTWNAIKADFSNLDPVIVAVEPAQLERGKQFVDALARRLRTDSQHFANVVEKLDTTGLDGKKLLLLSPVEIQTLRQRLEDAQELIASVAATPGLRQLLASINQEISQALVTHLASALLEPSTSPSATAGAAENGLDVTFLAALFGEMVQALATPHSYAFHSPWDNFFLKDSHVLSQEGYFLSSNERFLFLLVENRTAPSGFVKHAPPLQALRDHIQALRHDFPDVQAGVTGGIALSTDETVGSQRDTALATVISLLGVGLLYVLLFREIWSPLRVQITLQLAIGWSLGFIALTVGHLNILSVTFAPILIGLADNLGIHLAARYGEERTAGRDFHTALFLAARQVGPGIVTAAVSVTLAFYSVLLSGFPGLAELGWIAGSGELLCLLASFTILPALMAVSQRYFRTRPQAWQPSRSDPLRGLLRFPRTMLAVLALLTLAGVAYSPIPRLDYNMLRLQAHGTESVEWEYRLIAGSDRSSWYAISVAASLEELHRKKAQFTALPTVERVESLAAFFPTDASERLTRVRELAPLVEPISGAWEQTEPIDLDEIGELLSKIRFKLQRPPSEWEPNKRPSAEALEAARSALLAVQERLAEQSAGTASAAMEAFQRALMLDFSNKLTLLQQNVHPSGPPTLDDIPSYLRQRFIGKSGQYLLQVFARDNIWERDPMQTFVSQLQTVDADVTGPPVVSFYSIPQMLHGYIRGGIYALLTIIGLTFLHFRRVKPTVFALLPLGVSALWVIPGMAIFDVQFNIVNLMILPLFMGMATDNGIHLVDRALENPANASSPLASSTGKAVVLSSLTTVVGFGSLMVAQHTGIFSFGWVLALAVSSNLLAVLTVLPLLLRLFPFTPTRTSPPGTPASPHEPNFPSMP